MRTEQRSWIDAEVAHIRRWPLRRYERAQRFVCRIRAVKKYDKAQQRTMATWSIDCAERVLHLFEQVCPDDPRPGDALTAGRKWVETGEFSMSVIRRASLDAHAAAKEVKHLPAACAAAHAAGQAVATAHVAQHAYGGAFYALKAVVADGSPCDAMDRVVSERSWQEQHLPESLRSEIMTRIVVEDRAAGPFVTVVKGEGF